MLDHRQIVSAVCGFLKGSSNQSVADSCPAAVVDFTMVFPADNVPTKKQLVDFFVGNLSTVVPSTAVKVLTMLSDSERPLMAKARRLSSGTIEVAVRIDVKDTSKLASTKGDAQAAARNITAGRGG